MHPFVSIKPLLPPPRPPLLLHPSVLSLYMSAESFAVMTSLPSVLFFNAGSAVWGNVNSGGAGPVCVCVDQSLYEQSRVSPVTYFVSEYLDVSHVCLHVSLSMRCVCMCVWWGFQVMRWTSRPC